MCPETARHRRNRIGLWLQKTHKNSLFLFLFLSLALAAAMLTGSLLVLFVFAAYFFIVGIQLKLAHVLSCPLIPLLQLLPATAFGLCIPLPCPMQQNDAGVF